MQQLSDLTVIHSLLARHGFRFSKGLGQNFLINPSVCPRMAELCGADDHTAVLEIGPGIGVLTAELCRRAAKVAAVEVDRRLLGVLDETLAEFHNLTIIHGDVMKLDLAALIEEQFGGLRTVVCANLPYYITSPILMKLLESRLPVDAITVMVQKEAADRLCAPVGTRQAGAVTVAVQYYAEAEKLFSVSRGSFHPAPKVDSAVIRLRLRPSPAVDVRDEPAFFRVVKAGFGQRRKTLANALKAGLSLDKDLIQNAIEQTGLDPSIRAENLTMQQFADVTNLLFPGQPKP